ncbi:hypothetical protein QE404_000269 [Chryseobacterium camelliae]|uniref:EpsG family protein n=1 Tax=Chryseobacterium camelliae TaxID=1265445 RepID=A0ABU0TDG5_9FLAO|nr:hypothetical protein [Chryseobacterium camelliae]
MYFYYLTILLFFFPALLETSSPKLEGKIPYKKFFLSLIILVCIFQMGLRWETGTDWDAYLLHFNSQSLIYPFDNTEDYFEKGYTFLVLISKLIVPKYWFFLLIHSIILFLLIRKSYVYFTPYSFNKFTPVLCIISRCMGFEQTVACDGARPFKFDISI